MIIRGTPIKIENYVLVDNDATKILALEFEPLYIDENGIYYKRTKDLLEFMERSGLKCLN